MRGRIAGREYRKVWIDELAAAGVFAFGKVFDDLERAFVRESVACQITLEGAANEARLLIAELDEHMAAAAVAARDAGRVVDL